MINTKDLEKIIGLSLYTAYVQDEQAVSIMLISDRPEAGKSKVAMKFYGNKGVAFLSDVTAYALWRDYHSEIESGILKHLIVPEFLAPLSRKSETVQSFIATLQMLIEEGIMEIHTGFLDPIKLKAPSALGAIVCMPRREFMQRRQGWELSGFLSRFIVVSYTYNSDTVEEIFESIASRGYLGERNIKLDFPDNPVKVEIPHVIAQAAKSYVFEQTEKLRKTGMGYGFRTLKHFLCLLCADVIMQNAQNGNPTFEVNEDNLEEIKAISYLINEEFNAIKQEGHLDKHFQATGHIDLVDPKTKSIVGEYKPEVFACGFCHLDFKTAPALWGHWQEKHSSIAQDSYLHETKGGLMVDGNPDGGDLVLDAASIATEFEMTIDELKGILPMGDTGGVELMEMIKGMANAGNLWAIDLVKKVKAMQARPK